MKNKNLLVVATGLAGLFIFLSSFQQSQRRYLTVRTLEGLIGTGYDSKIITVNEYGGIEETELGKMSDKNFPENQKKISALFNKLAEKGYRLVSSTGSGVNLLSNTYVFEKQ